MKDFGIFYGSTTGCTANVARRLAAMLAVADDDVHDVADTAPDAVAGYRTLVLGTSTWGDGDLQDSWYDYLDGLKALSLRGKNVALFGCGDETMTETFCDGVGKLYEALKDSGATFIGTYPDDAFRFNHSAAEVDVKPVGLLLDEVNHADLTDTRLLAWADILLQHKS